MYALTQLASYLIDCMHDTGMSEYCICRSVQASLASLHYLPACATHSPATPQQTAPTTVPATPPPLLASASQVTQAQIAPSLQACVTALRPSPTAAPLAATPQTSAAALASSTAMAHAVALVR